MVFPGILGDTNSPIHPRRMRARGFALGNACVNPLVIA
jgi:hypothetical protein